MKYTNHMRFLYTLTLAFDSSQYVTYIRMVAMMIHDVDGHPEDLIMETGYKQ